MIDVEKVDIFRAERGEYIRAKYLRHEFTSRVSTAFTPTKAHSMARLDITADKDNTLNNDFMNDELLGAIQSGDIEYLLSAIAALQKSCDIINNEQLGGVSPTKEALQTTQQVNVCVA